LPESMPHDRSPSPPYHGIHRLPSNHGGSQRSGSVANLTVPTVNFGAAPSPLHAHRPSIPSHVSPSQL
jgi:hypothetical protein